MRIEVSTCGIALALLAGCAGAPAGGSGWRIFDSAFDGLENARLVHETPADLFDVVWQGASAFGHKAYFESALRKGETIHLVFRADAGPQVELELARIQSYECPAPRAEPRRDNITIEDAWANGYLLQPPGECVFHLTLARDVVAENGVNCVWVATTIAGDARDRGPGGGAALRFDAARTD